MYKWEKATVSQEDFAGYMGKIARDNYSKEGIQAIYYYLRAKEKEEGKEYLLNDLAGVIYGFMEYQSTNEMLETNGYQTIKDLKEAGYDVIHLNNGGIMLVVK